MNDSTRFELPFFQPTGALRITGRYNDEQKFLVFFEIAETLPGLVKTIPKEGGKKYAWDNKVTFLLDLEDLSRLACYLSGGAGEQSFDFYRLTPDRKEKILKFITGEKGKQIVKAILSKKEIFLTLLPADVYLLTKALNSLMEKCLWTPIAQN